MASLVAVILAKLVDVNFRLASAIDGNDISGVRSILSSQSGRHPGGSAWVVFSPVAEAAQNGRRRITLLLLARGVRAGDALSAAAQYGSWNVASAVIRAGYQIPQSALQFCLWRALAARRPNIVRELLVRGLPANTARFGEPAICAAAFLGDTATVKVLYTYGASANSVTRDGDTALMSCTAGSISENFGVNPRNQTSTARLLLSLGASEAARDRTGRTALDRAWLQPGAPRPLRQAGQTGRTVRRLQRDGA